MTEQANYIEKLDKIHPYPAKFPVSAAARYILEYSKPGDTVFDPFVGSGSSVLAATVNGRAAFGLDINAAAILISKFKLINIDDKDTAALRDFLCTLTGRIAEKDYGELYHYDSVEHWFCRAAIESLSCIKNTVHSCFAGNCKLKTFCELVMSAVINTVSNQESDTRYAAVQKDYITHSFVLDKYTDKFLQSIDILRGCVRDIASLDASAVFLHNSKRCEEVIPENSVDMMITSPPYPNTYDYYLYHKHRMLWLGEDFKYAMNEEIGSRREFSSLKKPRDNFAKDLYEIFLSCSRVLKPDGTAVIIIGDGKIRGEMYDSKENTVAVCEKLGWRLIDYSFTELDNTSRSFQSSFRTNGKKEHILTFRKG